MLVYATVQMHTLEWTSLVLEGTRNTQPCKIDHHRIIGVVTQYCIGYLGMRAVLEAGKKI